MIPNAGDRQYYRDRSVAVADENFFSGLNFVEVIAEAVLEFGDVNGLHNMAIIAMLGSFPQAGEWALPGDDSGPPSRDTGILGTRMR